LPLPRSVAARRRGGRLLLCLGEPNGHLYSFVNDRQTFYISTISPRVKSKIWKVPAAEGDDRDLSSIPRDHDLGQSGGAAARHVRPGLRSLRSPAAAGAINRPL
jgi:hypothetical protein